MFKEKIEQLDDSWAEVDTGELQSKVKHIVDAIGAGKYYESIAEFGKQIQSEYPNFKDYSPYHIFSGSAPPEGVKLINKDFPGDCSVKKFIDELYEEVVGNNNEKQ